MAKLAWTPWHPMVKLRAELFERHPVFTLDSDFSVYRKNGREPLDLIFPPRG